MLSYFQTIKHVAAIHDHKQIYIHTVNFIHTQSVKPGDILTVTLDISIMDQTTDTEIGFDITEKQKIKSVAVFVPNHTKLNDNDVQVYAALKGYNTCMQNKTTENVLVCIK